VLAVEKMSKTYQIECGKIQGFYTAGNEMIAFRKAMRLNNWKRDDWGKLARFRMVVLSDFKIVKKGRWYYQDPNSLFKKTLE
jgi:hypothetical protein